MSNKSERARRLAFARRMVDKYETAIADQEAGVVQVSTDGVTVTYQSAETALANLEMWRKQVSRYSRSKSRTSTIRLNG